MSLSFESWSLHTALAFISIQWKSQLLVTILISIGTKQSIIQNKFEFLEQTRSVWISAHQPYFFQNSTFWPCCNRYNDVIMSAIASQITRKSSASLASPVTGEFLAQRASNAENISIWWRHHDMVECKSLYHTTLSWNRDSIDQTLSCTSVWFLLYFVKNYPTMF